ncbi:MAG TPA: L-threonylcarbamoyladenylate synthase, partial [Candidatus Saccharimonas sp.]|nr:L-threonylcarbamoyladenylate synthase [Candidatus Saccharimonas sp.]
MKSLAAVEEAVAVLMCGGVGVLPTDTVYGLAAMASDRQAVERLYALKRREHKPGTLIAASVEQLVELGIAERHLRRVQHLWPNSLSVVVEAGDELEYLHMGLASLAVRVPGDETVRAWLEVTGPLLTSSANQPGEPTAQCLAEARAYFGETVDFYVDGGDLSKREPSTVIRIAGGRVEVLR